MLSRLWTYTVWVCFLVLVPLWVMLWYSRHPVLGILQAVFVASFLLRHALPELRRQ